MVDKEHILKRVAGQMAARMWMRDIKPVDPGVREPLDIRQSYGGWNKVIDKDLLL
ncbi:hypothetical protein [Aliiroseovarius sp.]|uniref:hypothetical protein n=1 Tax=Aliiroseovarius sp. TaxID=1872442 RepID=UPI0026276029|nr:hypothetical protein [Aliiroseovarius sp.]